MIRIPFKHQDKQNIITAEPRVMDLPEKPIEASNMKLPKTHSLITDRAKSLLMSAMLVFAVGTPVQAEDIEIYEGLTDNDANSGTSTTFKPNILNIFIGLIEHTLFLSHR